MARILIIDDEVLVCQMLRAMVAELGHVACCAQTLTEGWAMARDGGYDLILLDVCLPDGNGLHLMPQLQNLPDSPEIVILTGRGDPEGAELAMRHGAWDYLEKQSSYSQVGLTIKQALQYRQERQENARRQVFKPEGLVGRSRAMHRCLELLGQAAASEANVLLVGLTGTGKELCARAIHEHSARRERSFVVVDCAALPENLVLSTLFGHEKGAFTGADKALPGLIAQAHGGTLLLDEVGELAPAMQKIFLRVLQERRYRPLGAGSDRVSDFRLIAATHRNLEDMVQQGTFRQDLYYRLASLVITLPPLKDRDGDLYELTLYHLDRLYQRQGVAPKEVEPEFFHALACHDWPGNVRELMQVLEGALAQARDHKLLLTRHLPAYLRAKWARARMLKSREALVGDGSPAKAGESLPPLADVRQAVWQQVEENYLRDLLHRTRGDFHSACQISGLSRARFYALLKKHQLSCSAACH